MINHRHASHVCGWVLAMLLPLAPHTAAQNPGPTLTTLYSFRGQYSNPPDGWVPEGVVVGPGGTLYGTTLFGGAHGVCVPGCAEPGFGTVFELTPPSSPGGAWSEAVLLNFRGGQDGANPMASVVVGKDGVLYGTASDNNYRATCGTVFALAPPALPGGAWAENVLHRFRSGNIDGCEPRAGVSIGESGILYGTTLFGGASGAGAVFALIPPASSGGSWSEETLHSFAGSPGDGYEPNGLAIGKDGVLFGATEGGGTGSCTAFLPGCGTVFSLTPPASPGAAWVESVLYSFMGAPGDGMYPYAGLVIGSDPSGRTVLYGTTPYGGSGPCVAGLSHGCGTVFSLTAPASPGGAWTEAVLYDFMGTPGDGAYPFAGLVIGSGPDGHPALYGTNAGVSSSGGIVFSLTPPASQGGAWTETLLYTLPGASDSSGPDSVLAIGRGTDGHPVFYGTTAGGGTVEGLGTVFSLQP